MTSHLFWALVLVQMALGGVPYDLLADREICCVVPLSAAGLI